MAKKQPETPEAPSLEEAAARLLELVSENSGSEGDLHQAKLDLAAALGK